MIYAIFYIVVCIVGLCMLGTDYVSVILSSNNFLLACGIVGICYRLNRIIEALNKKNNTKL